MTYSDSRLDGFEQRLLDALKDELRTDDLPTRSAGRRRRRVAVAVATAAAAVAVGIAVPVAFGARSGAKAFAVTTGADGSVTVQIFRLTDATGLEKALRSHGIRADITYLPPGKVCREPRYVRSTQPWGASDLDTSHGVKFTFHPPIPRTGTWVMEYGGHQARAHDPLTGGMPGGYGVAFHGHFGVTQGPVAPCVLVPEGP